jgi:hypothetical protein
MPDQPDWVLDLVAAVEHYEYTHSKVTDPDECFRRQLDAVPTGVRDMAQGWAQAKRAALRAEEKTDADA